MKLGRIQAFLFAPPQKKISADSQVQPMMETTALSQPSLHLVVSIISLSPSLDCELTEGYFFAYMFHTLRPVGVAQGMC